MTIYILGTPQETAEALDDKSLDKMIKDVAQILQFTHAYTSTIKVPHPVCRSQILGGYHHRWTEWARECKANYLHLVDLGIMCFTETVYRDINKRGLRQDKYGSTLIWARDNVPDLPSKCPACDLEIQENFMCQVCWNDKKPAPFPLVMPKKYQLEYIEGFESICHRIYGDPATIESYRNYYQAKLKQKYQCSICKGQEYLIDEEFTHKCICYGAVDQLWTRRSKPEWL